MSDDLCKRLERKHRAFAPSLPEGWIDTSVKREQGYVNPDGSEAAARIRELEAERDSARSECAWTAKMLLKFSPEIRGIAEDVEDEGGRVYFGTTDQADLLKEIAEALDSFEMDRLIRDSKWPDYIEASRKANTRAEAAEARMRELEAERDEAFATADAHEQKWQTLCQRTGGTCACSYDAPDDICSLHSPKLAAAEADNARLRAELAEARETLEPFAKAYFMKDMPGETRIYENVRVVHFRHAAAAIRARGEGGGEGRQARPPMERISRAPQEIQRGASRE